MPFDPPPILVILHPFVIPSCITFDKTGKHSSRQVYPLPHPHVHVALIISISPSLSVSLGIAPPECASEAWSDKGKREEWAREAERRSNHSIEKGTRWSKLQVAACWKRQVLGWLQSRAKCRKKAPGKQSRLYQSSQPTRTRAR
jgi:hypothetical protein